MRSWKKSTMTKKTKRKKGAGRPPTKKITMSLLEHTRLLNEIEDAQQSYKELDGDLESVQKDLDKAKAEIAKMHKTFFKIFEKLIE